MQLPNIDHVLADMPSIPEAHAYYTRWIAENMSENRAAHTHVSPFTHGAAVEHAGECVFLQAFQNGSSLTLSRLRKRLPTATKAFYGKPIELPEVHVFVGETAGGFSMLRRGDHVAVKIDLRTALILTLYQFFLGAHGGTDQSRQLAVWLLLSVVTSRQADFDEVLIALTHEAQNAAPAIFGDMVGSVADLILLHEVGHVLEDRLPEDFSQIVFLPPEDNRIDPTRRVGAAYMPAGTRPESRGRPIAVDDRLALPEALNAWGSEFTCDCFATFAQYLVLLEVHDGNRRIAIEAMCESLLSWNLTFFALWSLQHLRAMAASEPGDGEPAKATHPEGLTRCDILLFFINHIMARELPEYRSPGLKRSVVTFQRLWSGPIEQSLQDLRSYLVVAPEAYESFVDRLLRPILTGCLYDSMKGIGGSSRLQDNILEKGAQWGRFHAASQLNGQPVFIALAEQLATLDVHFVSEDRT